VKISPVHPEIFDKICQTYNAISISIFSCETTGPIFTKILHDVVALVALFNLAHTPRYPIPFLNDRAISARGDRLPWQCPLRYRKKKVGLIISNSIPTIWCKDCENRSGRPGDTSAPSEQVCYDTKFVAMATSLEILKKISDLSSTPKAL